MDLTDEEWNEVRAGLRDRLVSLEAKIDQADLDEIRGHSDGCEHGCCTRSTDEHRMRTRLRERHLVHVRLVVAALEKIGYADT